VSTDGSEVCSKLVMDTCMASRFLAHTYFIKYTLTTNPKLF
jgi:hypothetical protein